MLQQIPLLVLNIVATILIGIILYIASAEDIQTRTIKAKWVISLYLVVSVYSIISQDISMESTYVFLFCFILFMTLAIISRGQFGFGDALVLGAMGWYYHSWDAFRLFLFLIGVVSIPWAVYWTYYYKIKKGLSNIINGKSTLISVDEAQPGMVLAHDRFMHGLSTGDIERLKADGHMHIKVKQPLPFIPVIFIAFIVTIFI
jgi:prepilin signal peptidase PulO-like enzyme (type II secretory pathway)